MTPYHKILGINENASKDEIKSAYRSLAKKFHPDINKSIGAEEVFVRITEAYEYLMFENKQNVASTSRAQKEYKERMYKQWVRNNQSTASEKGRQHANMKYKEYKKTVVDEAPLLFYGFKLMGCLTTATLLLIVMFIIMSFNPELGQVFVLLFIPLAALIMTVGEKHIKIKDVLRWFK
ncbi:MAG: DnaJ domain-containing protein [Bacteroidia bacterium]|nr:DnaJ domain-containing protein [Bacteroidia bacterium]